MQTNVTDTATLVLGKIAAYGEWTPTNQIRWALHSKYVQAGKRLQQRWHRNFMDTTGAISGGEFEWRDVPLEIEEERR